MMDGNDGMTEKATRIAKRLCASENIILTELEDMIDVDKEYFDIAHKHTQKEIKIFKELLRLREEGELDELKTVCEALKDFKKKVKTELHRDDYKFYGPLGIDEWLSMLDYRIRNLEREQERK